MEVTKFELNGDVIKRHMECAEALSSLRLLNNVVAKGLNVTVRVADGCAAGLVTINPATHPQFIEDLMDGLTDIVVKSQLEVRKALQLDEPLLLKVPSNPRKRK